MFLLLGMGAKIVDIATRDEPPSLRAGVGAEQTTAYAEDVACRPGFTDIALSWLINHSAGRHLNREDVCPYFSVLPSWSQFTPGAGDRADCGSAPGTGEHLQLNALAISGWYLHHRCLRQQAGYLD